MWRDFTTSVEQLNDRPIVAVIAKSLAITLVLCALLGWAVASVADQLFARYLESGLGRMAQDSYYVVLKGAALAMLALFAVVIGFRAVAIPVIGFFADEVVAAVEARHYPHAAASARKASVALSLRLGVVSLVRVLGINIVLLPIYVGLLLTAIGPLVVFLFVNALLLGRDLGEMVAVRHLEGPAVRQWLANTRWERAWLGLGMTAAFTVPLLNLLAPIIGAAMATHLFHKRRAGA